MKLPIYMDYHATTPLDPEVLKAMEPYLTEVFGNAASKSHVFGWTAEAAVERARKQVAQLIYGHEKEIYFTSGATESNNIAILGVAEKLASRGKHIITATTEHKAVMDPCKYLQEKGFDVTYLQVDATGNLNLDELRKAITQKTILITLMSANNEIGTIHPIAEIGKIAKEFQIYFHTDGAQAIGKIPMDVEEMGVDLLSISGHKIYGPKGIGALYVRQKNPKVSVAPILYGGGHEGGLRSGTPNVPGIVGLGAALEKAQRVMGEESIRLQALRDKLHRLLKEGLEGVELNGPDSKRLVHNLNVSFSGVRSEPLIMAMRDLAVSTGSACTSASPEPSHVLKALGLTEARIRSSIRFGLGRFTTEEEVDYAADLVVRSVKKLREKSVGDTLAPEGLGATTMG